jgi:CheY-like chemotaxis protein
MMEHHDSGFSFCNKVKKIPELAKVPLLMLTGVMRETGMDFSGGTREERSWIKADQVIAKPVSPQQLCEIITRHLAAARS